MRTSPLEAATAPGDAGIPNEDLYGWLPGQDAVIVLDGVTVRAGIDSGCRHGTPWYVRTLARQALFHLAAPSALPLTTVVATAIGETAGQHDSTCDLDTIGAPSAALAVIRVIGDMLEWLMLADVTIALLMTDGSITVISDNRVAWSVEGIDPDSENLGELLAVARTAHRNQPGPGAYWVAANDPDAARHAITGRTPVRYVQSVLITTDGAARWVDLFGHSWEQAFALGPQNLIEEVRALEASDPACTRWPRMKDSDDATALLWSPPGNSHPHSPAGSDCRWARRQMT
jgi:hypothetical protein